MTAVKNEKKRQSIIPMVNFLYLAAVFTCVLFPGYSQYRAEEQGKEDLKVCRANIEQLKDIVEDYRRTHKGEVPDSLVYFTRKGPDHALDALPRCPAYNGDNASMVYSMGYSRIPATPYRQAEFTICCCGNNHAILGLGKGQPYYSSVSGAHPTDFEIDKMKSSAEDNHKGSSEKSDKNKASKKK